MPILLRQNFPHQLNSPNYSMLAFLSCHVIYIHTATISKTALLTHTILPCPHHPFYSPTLRSCHYPHSLAKHLIHTNFPSLVFNCSHLKPSTTHIPFPNILPIRLPHTQTTRFIYLHLKASTTHIPYPNNTLPFPITLPALPHVRTLRPREGS